MPENRLYLPEGLRPPATLSLSALKSALETRTILESTAVRCDTNLRLHVQLEGVRGIIPREEAIATWISGAGREIALLSRVGKPVCFQVMKLQADEKGETTAILSRRSAQETALHWMLENLSPGMVVTARVTHLESFGVFLDIGCGVIAMLPCERISVSRISHPKERFQVGQKILVAVAAVDRENRRFTMTHKELLGTWMENASWFQPGETVQGIVRSVKSYGAFVELTPNLSGLADIGPDIKEGDRVSVYIKNIRPERMKIKLQIIEKLSPVQEPPAFHYQVTDGQLSRWVYSPPNYERDAVETMFKEDP